MNTKFSPKFTIATAYPMMFSSDDLGYIETEMLNFIRNGTVSSLESSDLSNTESFKTTEITKLENIWKIDATDYPQRS
ncbi:MAG: hypothetical protein F6K11_17320 [Leptolyngbya sp. SIO3F4]|nr:hypothetical protein [Leptolyngbya sp. SIO3F4]